MQLMAVSSRWPIGSLVYLCNNPEEMNVNTWIILSSSRQITNDWYYQRRKSSRLLRLVYLFLDPYPDFAQSQEWLFLSYRFGIEALCRQFGLQTVLHAGHFDDFDDKKEDLSDQFKQQVALVLRGFGIFTDGGSTELFYWGGGEFRNPFLVTGHSCWIILGY